MAASSNKNWWWLHFLNAYHMLDAIPNLLLFWLNLWRAWAQVGAGGAGIPAQVLSLLAWSPSVSSTSLSQWFINQSKSMLLFSVLVDTESHNGETKPNHTFLTNFTLNCSSSPKSNCCCIFALRSAFLGIPSHWGQ